MVWVSVFSVGLLVCCCYLFVRRNRDNRDAILGLLLKMTAGVALGLIYAYHYGGGDTFQYFHESETITDYFLRFPQQFFSIYFDTMGNTGLTSQLVFYDQPRALLFAKIISVFYMLTGGNYWIIGAWLSLINFLCIYLLVGELNRRFPEFKKAAAISFYYLPTFVFWSSGLLKESLAIGVLALAVAMTLQLLRTQKYTDFPCYVILFFAAFLLWELKYFYAAVAVPLLMVLLARDILAKWIKVSNYHVAFMVLIGFFIVSRLHYNLNMSRVLEVIYNNHQLGLNASGLGTIHFYQFDGSVYGFLINLPLALFSGLFRPLVFEISNGFQGIVAVENTIALVLLLMALWQTRFWGFIKNPMVFSVLIYVILLAVLLAFATPNFGTLSRYKAGYWPFFMYLVLILNEKSLQNPWILKAFWNGRKS